jgi:putative photosynthetic complex assembly protein
MSGIVFEPEPGSSGDGHTLKVPKPALYMAGLVVLTTFARAIAASVFGIGADREQPSAVLVERMLRFQDSPDHGITVIDATTNTVAVQLPPNGNGFLRGALRALTGRRRAAGVGSDQPFRLVRYVDGRLVLIDPVTTQHVTISSFGTTQIESFDNLLKANPGPGPAADAPFIPVR